MPADSAVISERSTSRSPGVDAHEHLGALPR